MSVDSNDASRATVPNAATLFARAAAADRRADARLATEIDDFFLDPRERLDDRTRAAMGAVLIGAVGMIEREIADHAARQLAGHGHAAPVAVSEGGGPATLARLLDAGLLRDRELMAELLAQVRQDLLGEALVTNRPPGSPMTLLARLTDCTDGVVAAAASAFLLAASRRRAPGAGQRGELPATLHRRLVWWVAAALRTACPGDARPNASIDQAFVAAAERSLAAYDETERLEAVAMRLAAAIDARGADFGVLLAAAIEEGHPVLFAAVAAHALGLDFAEARALMLDPDGDRLWLALRAQGLERATIARIGLALADADPRRDIEMFADELDTIAAIPVTDAREALASLALHPDFRAALRAIEQARPR